MGVVDADKDGQCLLSATLFVLGCRVVPLDCQADSGGAIGPQLKANEPEVVVWRLAPVHGPAGGPLLSLLASRALVGIGVVVLSTSPVETADLLRDHHVHVLASPFTAVALMGAVRDAHAARARSTPVVA
ncbi:hypothetical protein [Luteitalea sp. TBR-22]|uniref:hypothetical protein n=1 Tax=Luteitalea sp. TBR-22 TaxID=2802971 RepID=UPI001EF3E560|nr:hypothetical protein [Luteitalea sp. TBR-22]